MEMLKVALIIFIIINCIVMFALLKASSNFDDEVEKYFLKNKYKNK